MSHRSAILSKTSDTLNSLNSDIYSGETNLSLTIEARISKKYAIYLPKAVVEAVGLKEGDKVLLRVTGNTVLLESLQDPIELALTGKKFTSIKPEQIEEISLGEQTGHTKRAP